MVFVSTVYWRETSWIVSAPLNANFCFFFPGTWVNEVRLQRGVKWELSDGDTLIFGGQSAPGSPEFLFLFQKVKVRPLDFDAITIPKVINRVAPIRFLLQRVFW